MCGRYALYLHLPLIADLFRVQGKLPVLMPRFNIAPAQDIPVVREPGEGTSRELAMMRWGFVPSWSKDPAKIGPGGAPPPINARSETVESKPSFRETFKRRRCLIPADGFYEWKSAPGNARMPKQPFLITVGDKPFAMAGLWEHWEPRAGQEHAAFDSCVILTTSPNALLATLHDRMPVIVPQAHWDRWLAPETSDEEARAMLRPLPADQMSMRPVSRRINSPLVDNPSCIEPAEVLPPPQEPPSLFESA